MGGAPVALIRNNILYYVQNDQVGRPEIVTNQAKAVVWRASNFAYDRTVTTNTIGGLNLGFPGQYYDSESGLYYNWNRYYDPSTGRYLQSDPIGLAGGLNTYVYALNRPTSLIDPTGLECGCVADGQQRQLENALRSMLQSAAKGTEWTGSAITYAGIATGDAPLAGVGGLVSFAGSAAQVALEPSGENWVGLAMEGAGALIPFRAGSWPGQAAFAWEFTDNMLDVMMGMTSGLPVELAPLTCQ